MQTSFDIPAVLRSLEQRLGWRNPTEAGYDIVSCGNEISKSGRYFNDDSYHPACNIQYIKDCQPNAKITNDEFNDYLCQLRTANVIDVVSEVIDQSSYMEDGLLFETTEHFSFHGVNNSGKFVGIRILPEKKYVINVKNVIFHFDGDASFTLYLHNQFAGQVAKWTVNAKANRQFIFPLSTVIMQNSSTAIGGAWFLSYDQTELGNVKAIDYNPCTNEFVCMCAASFMADRLGEGTFDMVRYSTTNNMYGMNMEVSNYKDMTASIIQNPQMFDKLQGLMMAAKALDIIINTSRSNEKERITKALQVQLYRELNNVTTTENPFEAGLKNKIRKEVIRVRKSFFPKGRSITVEA